MIATKTASNAVFSASEHLLPGFTIIRVAMKTITPRTETCRNAAGKKADAVAGKSEASQVPAEVGEKAAGNKAVSIVYKKNIAPAAMNMRAAVSPTTARESQELGWSFINLRSDATNRIPTSKNGASTPLMTAVQKSAPIGLTFRKSKAIPTSIEKINTA